MTTIPKKIRERELCSGSHKCFNGSYKRCNLGKGGSAGGNGDHNNGSAGTNKTETHHQSSDFKDGYFPHTMCLVGAMCGECRRHLKKSKKEKVCNHDFIVAHSDKKLTRKTVKVLAVVGNSSLGGSSMACSSYGGSVGCGGAGTYLEMQEYLSITLICKKCLFIKEINIKTHGTRRK